MFSYPRPHSKAISGCVMCAGIGYFPTVPFRTLTECLCTTPPRPGTLDRQSCDDLVVRRFLLFSALCKGRGSRRKLILSLSLSLPHFFLLYICGSYYFVHTHTYLFQVCTCIPMGLHTTIKVNQLIASWAGRGIHQSKCPRPSVVHAPLWKLISIVAPDP